MPLSREQDRLRKQRERARKRAELVAASPKPVGAAEGRCVRTHTAELERMGMLESSQGSIALALAAILDEQKGAVGAAATADRLERVMESLRRRQPVEPTELDKLRERRARRGA